MPVDPSHAIDLESTGPPPVAERVASSSQALEVNPPQEFQESPADEHFNWTAKLVAQSVALFVIAAAFEVGGGWLIWQTIRVSKPWWWALLGSVVLVGYGFVPTFQPISNFGRVFAVYGGFFIVYSYGWGWALDGQKPDTGDFAGAGIAILGVCVCWFWPRKMRVD